LDLDGRTRGFFALAASAAAAAAADVFASSSSRACGFAGAIFATSGEGGFPIRTQIKQEISNPAAAASYEGRQGKTEFIEPFLQMLNPVGRFLAGAEAIVKKTATVQRRRGSRAVTSATVQPLLHGWSTSDAAADDDAAEKSANERKERQPVAPPA
jgi:hypothetical protein